jgi:8-oxo-dGTP pyrophosphatase MutT (NUDIX family)
MTYEIPGGAGTAGDEIPVIPAASVLVLRDGPLEVLMMRRHEKSSFVPGVWVFPGGAVDDADRRVAGGTAGGLDVMKVCAIRELFEEAGVWIGEPFPDRERVRHGLLDGSTDFETLCRDYPPHIDDLVLTSRWVTPLGIPRRFDTFFFLARAPKICEPIAEEREATELVWIEPDVARQRCRERSMPMVFPTIRNLEAIRGFRSIDELIASRRDVDIPVTRPVLVVDGSSQRIVLPEES